MSHLAHRYNQQDDVFTVAGIRYHGAMFRQLGGILPVGKTFQIAARKDGVLALVNVDQSSVVQQLDALAPTEDNEAAHRRADELLLAALRVAGLNDVADAWKLAKERCGFSYE